MAVDQIYIDAHSIDALGKAFLKASEDVRIKGIDALKNIKVEAGTFQEATDLVSTITARVESLSANLEGLYRALAAIGTKLQEFAKQYTTADTQNGATADSIGPLIDAITADLPGMK